MPIKISAKHRGSNTFWYKKSQKKRLINTKTVKFKKKHLATIRRNKKTKKTRENIHKFWRKSRTKRRNFLDQNSYIYLYPIPAYYSQPSIPHIYTQQNETSNIINSPHVDTESVARQAPSHQNHIRYTYQNHDDFHGNDSFTQLPDAQYLIDIMKATSLSLSSINDPFAMIDVLKENIVQFENYFNQLYHEKKFHTLPEDGKIVLAELAKVKEKLIDIEASTTKGVKIKKILKNKPYSNLISNFSQNNSFDILENEIISSFYTLDQDILQSIINNTNALINDNSIFYFHQSTSIDGLLHNNFFKKISEGKGGQNPNNLAMMSHLSHFLSNATNDIKEKLLKKIAEYMNHCIDQAVTGLQLTGCLAIAYASTEKDNNSIEKNIIAVLVDIYKKEMLNRILVKRGAEELEGLAYLTEYLGHIVFPSITMPPFSFTEFGIAYIENECDPIKNLDKILNKIADSEALVKFIHNGIYDGVPIGEMLFEEIIKNDTKYRELKKICEGTDFIIEPPKDSEGNYTNFISDDAKIYWMITNENEADKFQQTILESRQNILYNYKKEKTEELLKKYGYLY
ncbi:MAG: hypothetical protein LBH49_01840 [Puniceicoccales bacterium]|jgi:hypothetical protein|nr:hypothetical protein [Puniceicoccales bacterium]